MTRLCLWTFLWVLSGCIKAPEIVMVDRATALEQQAGASFDEVEQQLARQAVAPRPVPLTPNQLEALGIKPAPIVDQTDQTEADRLDALLLQHCVGEGKEGLLVDTHDDCIGATDLGVAIELLNRTNRARVQLWQWLSTQRPDLSVQVMRQSWVSAHARGVVCGGWQQRSDGGWGAKAC